MKETYSAFRYFIRFEILRAFSTVYGLMYVFLGILIPLILYISTFQPLSASSLPSLGFLLFLVPIMLPLFSQIGSSGTAYLFSSDRANGVYEYLLASKTVKVSDIFMTYSISGIIITSVILGVNLAIFYGSDSIRFLTVPWEVTEFIIIFTVPISYFSTLISILSMLTWASLTKRYPGVNAPGGIGTIIGMIPVLVFFILIMKYLWFQENIIFAGEMFSVILGVIFVILTVTVIRLMSNERMLP